MVNTCHNNNNKTNQVKTVTSHNNNNKTNIKTNTSNNNTSTRTRNEYTTSWEELIYEYLNYMFSCEYKLYAYKEHAFLIKE